LAVEELEATQPEAAQDDEEKEDGDEGERELDGEDDAPADAEETE
jgi:hypothetical protein